MKKFNVKRLLSLIVLSLAVAAYSFAYDGLVSSEPGSKAGLISIGNGYDLEDGPNMYVIENETKENVVLNVLGNGKDNDPNKIVYIEAGSGYTVTKDDFITPWPEEGYCGSIDIWIIDIKEEDRYRYSVDQRFVSGGEVFVFTVYKN